MKKIIYIICSFFICSCAVTKNKASQSVNNIYYTFDDTALSRSISTEINKLIESDKKKHVVSSTVRASDYYLILDKYVNTYEERKVLFELCCCDGKACAGSTKELVETSNRYFKLNPMVQLPIIFESDLLYSDKALINGLRPTYSGGGYLIEVNFKTGAVTSAFQD